MTKAIHVALTLSILALLAIGCSDRGAESATAPDVPDLSPVAGSADSQRMLWGMWNIRFDTAELTATIEPIRNPQAHFNITDMLLPPACDDCLAITVNSFDPVTRILDADVTLKNPYSISGYDVRGILYTNDYGHELRNADDWTALWDIPGGESINPFMAFAKGIANRVFAGLAEHTESYRVYIPIPPAYFAITFMVDASWPGNCKEPYAFNDFLMTDLYDYVGAKAQVSVDVLDHQGDVDGVSLTIPGFAGGFPIALSYSSGNTWEAEITNIMGTPAGIHRSRLAASSVNSGAIILNDYVTVTIKVEGIPQNPIIEKYVSLGGMTLDVAISDGYAFMADYLEGLRIVDVDPVNSASVIHTIESSGYITGVAVNGNYAYAAEDQAGEGFGLLHIIDIEQPGSPDILKTVYIPLGVARVAVLDGYAYVTDGSNSGGDGHLHIVDVDPINQAYIVNSISLVGYTRGVAALGNLAYVTVSNSGGPDSLSIININPPESANILKEVPMPLDPALAMDVAADFNYAYVADRDGGLQIVDINPPESANIIKDIGSIDAYGVAVHGGYAYLCCLDKGLRIIDITPPESAYILKTVVTNSARGVAIADGYAYVADGGGLQIIKLW